MWLRLHVVDASGATEAALVNMDQIVSVMPIPNRKGSVLLGSKMGDAAVVEDMHFIRQALGV